MSRKYEYVYLFPCSQSHFPTYFLFSGIGNDNNILRITFDILRNKSTWNRDKDINIINNLTIKVRKKIMAFVVNNYYFTITFEMTIDVM